MINIGPQGMFSLSDQAIHHIITGDLTDRQDRDENNRTKLVTVIGGGLHTIEGVKQFLSKRLDIKHGLFFQPKVGETWYYARALQNGVTLLKIPREGFQSKAAKITEFPEIYYKSGYLWKTLFPEHFSKDDIIRAIDEALYSQDVEETQGDLIIGYTKNDDPIKVLKIRIQVRGTEIQSAFPTWGQPMTGNNGKPFSHIEAINTVISGSSIFLRGERTTILSLVSTYNTEKLEMLVKITPDFLLKRTIPKNEIEREGYRKSREIILSSQSEKMDEKQIDDLISLITSDDYVRYPANVMNFVYGSSYNKIRRYAKYKNAISLYQNLLESLIVINKWDIQNSKVKVISVIEYILSVRFINTGGLDQWEIKRVSNVMIDIIRSYNNSEITQRFLTSLSKSPCRIGFYVEFNVNPFFVTDLAIIGINDFWEKPMKERHLLEYVVQNLGINYIVNFDDESNLETAAQVQKDAGSKTPQLNNDAVRFAVGKDFNMFVGALPHLLESLDINDTTIGVLDSILYDYHRCLSSNIQQIMIRNIDVLGAHAFEYEYGTVEYDQYTKAKHKHEYLSTMNKTAINAIAEIIEKAGYPDDAKKIIDKYVSIAKEAKNIPMPKPLPKSDSDNV